MVKCTSYKAPHYAPSVLFFFYGRNGKRRIYSHSDVKTNIHPHALKVVLRDINTISLVVCETDVDRVGDTPRRRSISRGSATAETYVHDFCTEP